MNIIKEQLDEIKVLRDSSCLTNYDTTDYGFDGEKKTIIKKAQKNAAKLAYTSQSLSFQLLQQIDTFRDQIASVQKRGDQASLQEMFGIMASFLSGTKAIRNRDEFKEIFNSKF